MIVEIMVKLGVRLQHALRTKLVADLFVALQSVLKASPAKLVVADQDMFRVANLGASADAV